VAIRRVIDCVAVAVVGVVLLTSLFKLVLPLFVLAAVLGGLIFWTAMRGDM
jgi:hypothetical protein